MNDLKTIRQLIKMMVDNDISEIDLEGEGEKIKLKRGGVGGVGGPNNVQYVSAPAPTASAPAAPAPSAAAGDAGDAAAADAEDDSLITIDSPMVGSFYTASNPDADAFVNTGDSVSENTVVCIIEAMKVFNEIKAEVTGTIVEVLVKNGDAVEFGQPLFKIKP
ncbi:acetyl-CoA carboxylase biotin carboxyl carrier protein [Algisphaera agarilytica]|uniref:Biotin carboxyl carrier protein of acetyl-CoA carboxylase n=1 Tax=Algisphaera agarilytica TaxID=1385975 RepID=A0A7X0H890_9BACT|nr:acetyl-CoA carboxylase biotin carboxyl carrier protein [Algisphaera agarilytica]MBB6431093.1 acetyl-CoA carboxylase biotin carboxyl carrier protein [Algisphaera agarilytica]